MRATAEKAINVSAEAFEITKDAVNQQKNIRYNEINHLTAEMNFSCELCDSDIN